MIRRTSCQDLPITAVPSHSPIKTTVSPLYSTLSSGDWLKQQHKVIQSPLTPFNQQSQQKEALTKEQSALVKVPLHDYKKEWRHTHTPTSNANTSVHSQQGTTSIRLIEQKTTKTTKDNHQNCQGHQQKNEKGVPRKRCSAFEGKDQINVAIKHFGSSTGFPSSKENILIKATHHSKQEWGQVCNNGKEGSQTTKKSKAADFLNTIKQWKDGRQEKERSVTPKNLPKTQTDIKALNWLRKADFNKQNRQTVNKRTKPVVKTVTNIPEELCVKQRSRTPIKITPPTFLSQKHSSKSNNISLTTIESSVKQLGVSDWQIGNKLGEGRFGNVFAAVHRMSGLLVALKKIPKKTVKDSFMIDQLLLEVKIQNWVNHSNIVKVYGVFQDPLYVYLLLEYLEGGSLYQQLRRKGKLSEVETVKKARQICEAVKHVHDRGVAHRDIKPQNILLSHGVCKLGDFGWATFCDERRNTYCGTTDYVAPEIIEGVGYDMAVDLWCVGVLTYELMAGKTPFYHISRQETFRKIKNVSSEPLTFPDFFSRQSIDFISRLLQKQPQQRMSMASALTHPFLTSQL